MKGQNFNFLAPIKILRKDKFKDWVKGQNVNLKSIKIKIG